MLPSSQPPTHFLQCHLLFGLPPDSVKEMTFSQACLGGEKMEKSDTSHRVHRSSQWCHR